MAVFCSSLTSCFLGMVFTYFLNDFEIVPVAPIIIYYYYYYRHIVTLYVNQHFLESNKFRLSRFTNILILRGYVIGKFYALVTT